jgi:predicted dienelactone hydrolase
VNFAQYSISRLISLGIGISSVFIPVVAEAAERITFNYPPLGEFYIQVDDLETFAKTGKITSELAYYLDRLPPQQINKLPELLSTPLEVNPLSIYKFSNSTIGKAVIRNFGKGIRADIDQNGFFALRSAIISATFDPDGLNILNLLRQFPLKTIYVDLKVIDRYIQQGGELLEDRELISTVFFQSNSTENKSDVVLNKAENLQTQGRFAWNKQTLTYNNPHRSAAGYFDLYQPKSTKSNLPAPLIVISHGLASSRETFAYLGKHFASHGFAVAIIEHDDISLDKFDGFLAGSERFPEPNNLLDQPLDVKSVLDKLEQESQINSNLQGKLNLKQVGLIGQSFGGYTVLALAGAQLIPDKTAPECQKDSYEAVLLDLSSLAKCTFNQLSNRPYQLRDPRIKAVIALNPLGKIFGETGMSQIQAPTMFISGTNDLITPPVVEQIEPFTWLENTDKYLVLVKPGTHFSFLQEGLGILPVPDGVVGPSPSSAYPALKALSTAFFKTYIAQQPEYRVYLTRKYLPEINNDSFQLSIIRSLTKNQLEQTIQRKLD